ncbi:MAG: hypothetical protein E7270_03200 [Lachnospiraceae bacterium]|nr:hypothetical protein [Lachnospiraceae bacterium]MBQ4069372.1 hypothetical protein [Lachnospiraceae bacterium]
MKKSEKQTLIELLIGNILFGIIGILVLLLFPKGRLYNELGFVWGVLVSCGMTVHMYSSLKSSMIMGEFGALKQIKKSYIIRVAGIIVAFAFMKWLDFGNIIVGVIGLFALKFSAYIQPITHKIINKKSTGEGR